MGESTYRNRVVILLATFVLALVGAALLDPIPQDPNFHNFADKRPWLDVPNFGDTLSNIGFAVVGLWGLWTVLGPPGRDIFVHRLDVVPYAVFFAAVALVTLGSSYYHLAPDNDRLFWDRLPTTLGFMALFAAFLADRVHKTIAMRWLLPILVAVGVFSLWYWDWTEVQGHGDLRF